MPKFDEDSQKFTTWLESSGVTISPKIAIVDLRDQHQGRAVVAVEDIDADEVLYSIPRSSLINVTNCSLVDDHPHLKEKLQKLGHWEGLITVLLYELKAKKENSKWLPYFNVLPINDKENYQLNQLVHWSDEELKSLEPSLVLERVGKDDSLQMFNKLYPRIIIEELGLNELEGITTEDLYNVASLIMSYSFDVQLPKENVEEEDESQDEEGDEEEDLEVDDDDVLEGNEDSEEQEEVAEPDDIYKDDIENDGAVKSMVPLADTLNADTTLHNASLNHSEGDLIMKSIKPIKKGEQVYNSYFDHPNSEILRRYGYVESQGSLHDFGEVPLSLIKSYFVNNTNLTGEFLDQIFSILNDISESMEDVDEQVEIVLDSYDCYKSREVITELVFIVQVLSVISEINKEEHLDTLNDEARQKQINRIFQKCYQLIEGKKLTNNFKSNFQKILQTRLEQYPEVAALPYEDGVAFTRRKMAEVVLKSEYQSLKNCSDITETFQNGKMGKFGFIDDGKLIRNITKKRPAEESNVSKKKKKKVQ